MRKILLALTLIALLATTSSAIAAPATHEQRTFFARLTGGQEVPPVETRARGFAIFHLSKDGTELDYVLLTTRLNNAVVSHIHLGEKGVNGPPTVFLFGPVSPGGGRAPHLLAKGRITAADLVGPLAGQPLSALIDAMRAGGAYVNVHTNDGVDPAGTGPGDFPTGEIRGQIR